MGAQQTDTTLDQWLQAYVDEKGIPPRNALQLCAFARHRGATLKYREVCTALAATSGIDARRKDSLGSHSSDMASSSEGTMRLSLISNAQSVGSDGAEVTPRDLESLSGSPAQRPAAQPSQRDDSWSMLPPLINLQNPEVLENANEADERLGYGRATSSTTAAGSDRSGRTRNCWTRQLVCELEETKERVQRLEAAVQAAANTAEIGSPSFAHELHEQLTGQLALLEKQLAELQRQSPVSPEVESVEEVSEAERVRELSQEMAELRSLVAQLHAAVECRRLQALDDSARRIVSLPLSSRDPEAAPVRRSAPITPREICKVPSPESAASSPSVVDPQSAASPQGGSVASEASPGALAVLTTPRRLSPPSRSGLMQSMGLGSRAASAPDLHMDAGLQSPLGSAKIPTRSPLVHGRSAVSSSSDALRAPMILLPSLAGASPDTSQATADARNAKSPVVQLQFRHSRSTPIFSKVSEYLSAARTAAAPSRPLANQPGTLRQQISQGGHSASLNYSPASAAQQAGRLAPGSPPPWSPSSSSMASNCSHAPGMSASSPIGDKVQSVATAVRNRGPWASPSTPEKQQSPALEPLLEEGLEPEGGKVLLQGTEGDAALRRSGCSLVRTTSAPGQFQPLHSLNEMSGLEDSASIGIDDDDRKLGGGSLQVSAFLPTQVMVPPASEARAPAVPRIQLERNQMSNGAEMAKSSPPGTVVLNAQGMHQAVVGLPSQSYSYMLQTRPVSWTPRGSSPTHKRLSTPVPDQGARTSTPASTLTPRHPQVVQMGCMGQPMAAGGMGQLWSMLPSVHQPPPLSPFTASPARVRMPGSNMGYAGGSLGNNVQRGSRVMVQVSGAPGGSPQSGTFPLALGESGTRSVGVPAPDRQSYSVSGPPGSLTPPASAVWSEIGNVVTTASMQRRLRPSNG